MSAEGTPRTWTLSEKSGKPWHDPTMPALPIRVKPADECSFTDEILTCVIELEPILDLLHLAMNEIGTDAEGDPPRVSQEIAAILRAHGRLQTTSKGGPDA